MLIILGNLLYLYVRYLTDSLIAADKYTDNIADCPVIYYKLSVVAEDRPND